MNDSIKYLITGATIAVVCGAAGAVGGWTAATLKNEAARGQKSEVRSQKPGISIQSPVAGGQGSVFSGKGAGQNPVITLAPKAGGSNVAFRPSMPMGKMPMSYNQFQKLQEQPEVKKAQREYLEAQKRYSEAMKKAMGEQAGSRGQGAGSGEQVLVSSGLKTK